MARSLIRPGDKPDEPRVDDQLLAKVGQRVRAMRREQQVTLQVLSAACGVSVGVLSEIERGVGNPSLNTLVQVAHALGISVVNLLSVTEQHSPVVRRHERRALDARHDIDGDARIEILTPSVDGALEVVWITAPPGYDTSSTPFSHAGEGFGLVMSGRHEVYLDGEKHVLEPGDSITYQCSTPHWYKNPGPETVEAIWIVTPPTF